MKLDLVILSWCLVFFIGYFVGLIAGFRKGRFLDDQSNK